MRPFNLKVGSPLSKGGVAAAVAIVLIFARPAYAGNAKLGQTAFTQCQMCHTNAKGGPNGVGPDLWGVVGRKAGTLPGFYYSVAVRTSHITWTNDKLKAWIMAPYKLIPGNRMAFAGVSDPKQAENIVAYLDTLK